jgi:hypothetical protein
VTALDIARAAEHRFTRRTYAFGSAAGRRPLRGSMSNEKTRPVYLRQLPSQGYVAIEVAPAFSFLHGHQYHGSLVIERRAPWRRPGHTPPIIAEATGKSIEAVIQQLLPIAECNPAIGAALLRIKRQGEVEFTSRK